MNTIQKKWLIILQGLFFALGGVSILLNRFDNVNISLLLVASGLAGAYFLTSNKQINTIKIFKSMLIIEILMSILSAIAFYIWGNDPHNFILIFALFSIFFGMIPFFFLFGILTSGAKLRFDMAKFRLIGGFISLIFGFYLIAVKHIDTTETLKYIGIIMIVIGVSILFGFRLVQKIIDK
ncbi:MAG: hypothetical protein ACPG44_06085 [Polaribacter sp.]